MPFDLGPSLNNLGLDVTASGAVGCPVNLNLNLVFGVELAGWVTSGSLGDAAFVELNIWASRLTWISIQINIDFATSFLQQHSKRDHRRDVWRRDRLARSHHARGPGQVVHDQCQ